MAKKKLGSFEELGELSLKKEKKSRKGSLVPDYLAERIAAKSGSMNDVGKKQAATEAESEAEDNLFLRAMKGVKTLNDDQGRQVDSRPKPPEPPRSALDEEARKYLDQFIRGEVDFELEFTEEYMHGFVQGLDAKIFNQLKAGALSTEGHLDLHGLNADQAYESMLFFFKESYLQGRRCVLLVTGRGTNSPGGQAVLRRSVQSWLTREPLKRVVLAFCTARAMDGGPGALYVLLRKQKKTQGKVQWDRMNGPDDTV